MNNFVNIPILFFGTPEFALPGLEALVKNGYRIAGVVTRPDEPVGRKRALTPPPVKILAMKNGIPVFQPEELDVRDFARGKIPHADLFIVAAYGKIIPKKILDLPRLDCLNIHPSLLPRWRGPSPMQAAILAGDSETGVTIIKMDEQMDHGPIVAQTSMKYEVSSIRYTELHNQLAEIGAKLLMSTLPRWIAGDITPLAQDETRATYCKLITKDDGRIDWTKPAEEIERMIRAFAPWPGTWTLWPTESKIIRVLIEEAGISNKEPPARGPGSVWNDEQSPLAVKTGHGSLTIKKLRVEGKKTTDAESFIRGYPRIIGKTLIAERVSEMKLPMQFHFRASDR